MLCIAFGPPACIFTCFFRGTHVLTREIRGLRDPRTARGAPLGAKGLTLAPASAPAHAAFLSKKTTSRGPRRAPGASRLHFDTVFTCFSRRTHVLTRKKRRTVMPRIASGPQASATLCKKRRALPHPIPWGVTGKCGALGMHFYTVFTCFSCCTHVLTRKKRRAVMPRIAWGPPGGLRGPPACTFTQFLRVFHAAHTF